MGMEEIGLMRRFGGQRIPGFYGKQQVATPVLRSKRKNKKKGGLRIAYFQHPRLCTRTVKISKAMSSEAEHMIAITTMGGAISATDGSPDDHFDARYVVGTNDNKLLKILRNNKINVIHCSNFPDSPTIRAIGIRKKMPNLRVVHDAHDIFSVVHPAKNDLGLLEREAIAIQQCDAIIHVSSWMNRYTRERYGKKGTIVFSMTNKDLIPKEVKREFSSPVNIVYEGGLKRAAGHNRNFKSVFTKILNKGYNLYVYPTKWSQGYPVLKKHKNYFGHRSLEQGSLYNDLAMNCDIGLVMINNTSSGLVKGMMPNKLFEYLMCGIPVLSNLPGAMGFIKKHNVGVGIKNIGAINNNIINQLKSKKANVLAKRFDFTMESQIPILLKVYGR